jgi:hypothetical protein
LVAIGAVRLTNSDRLFLVQLYRWFPPVIKAVTIVCPEICDGTEPASAGCWRWKSRSPGGRPQIDADLRALIRQMSVDNPPWGARASMASYSSSTFEVAQSSVVKYMNVAASAATNGCQALPKILR